MVNQIESGTYMQLRLDLMGKHPVYLRVPTFWDDIDKKWRGAIRTPSLGLIHAEGKDDFELQNNFNHVLRASLESNPEETFSMFKALEYWEK